MERIREENQTDTQSPIKRIYISWDEKMQDDTNTKVIFGKAPETHSFTKKEQTTTLRQ
jgi:hypothetical protein